MDWTLVLILAGCVWGVIVYWKIFSKASKPGWLSVIPVYNTCVLLRIAGLPAWWLLLMCIPVVSIFVQYFLSRALARSFGRTPAFGWGTESGLRARSCVIQKRRGNWQMFNLFRYYSALRSES